MTEAVPRNALTPRRLAPVEVQEFLLFEARLLNERHFEQWLTLLTPDVLIWVPTRAEQRDGEAEASLIYDDREIIEARIKRLRHPKMWSQLPAARTVRLVSNITLDDDFDGEGLVHSSFIMLEYRQEEQRVFGGGYEHRLRRVEGGFRIAAKTVRLVNSEAMLWNLAVPF